MLMLIGLGVLVAGFVGAAVLFADIDGGLGLSKLVSAVCGILCLGLPAGPALFFIGLGMWIAHPHVIHIGG